jgi:hypothetical protein
MTRFRVIGYMSLNQFNGGPPYDEVGRTVVEAWIRGGAVQLGLDHFGIRGSVKGWVKIDELCPVCSEVMKQRPTKANPHFFEWHCPTCDPGEAE